jgi:hypothetical protein
VLEAGQADGRDNAANSAADLVRASSWPPTARDRRGKRFVQAAISVEESNWKMTSAINYSDALAFLMSIGDVFGHYLSEDVGSHFAWRTII